MSRDQAEEEEGGLNLYAFVENNPVTEIDPFGLFASGMHKQLTSESFDLSGAALTLTPKCKAKIVPLHDNLGEDDRDNPGEAIRGFRDKPGTG